LKRKNPYLFFEEIGKKIETILLEAAEKHGVALTVNRFGSMLNPFFAKQEVSNFKEAQACDTGKFSVFFWAMIRNGVFLPPSQYEAWFLSTALRESDLFVISKAVDKAMAAVSAAS
jgi:glutamate-1-semialdehyde 2,1-aminomutase